MSRNRPLPRINPPGPTFTLALMVALAACAAFLGVLGVGWLLDWLLDGPRAPDPGLPVALQPLLPPD